MKLSARLVSGEVIDVDYEGNDTVWDVKQRIAAREHTDPSKIRLFVSGKYLMDKEKMGDIRIEGLSTVHLRIDSKANVDQFNNDTLEKLWTVQYFPKTDDRFPSKICSLVCTSHLPTALASFIKRNNSKADGQAVYLALTVANKSELAQAHKEEAPAKFQPEKGNMTLYISDNSFQIDTLMLALIHPDGYEILPTRDLKIRNSDKYKQLYTELDRALIQNNFKKKQYPDESNTINVDLKDPSSKAKKIIIEFIVSEIELNKPDNGTIGELKEYHQELEQFLKELETPNLQFPIKTDNVAKLRNILFAQANFCRELIEQKDIKDQDIINFIKELVLKSVKDIQSTIVRMDSLSSEKGLTVNKTINAQIIKPESKKKPRYLMIDHNGVLGGEVAEIKENDLMLHPVEGLEGAYQVLKNGSNLMKCLDKLAKKGFKFISHSSNSEADQLKIINWVNEACQREKLPCPEFEAMVVYDPNNFANFGSAKPHTRFKNNMLVISFGGKLKEGKRSFREALESGLKISSNERSNHVVFDDGPTLLQADDIKNPAIVQHANDPNRYQFYFIDEKMPFYKAVQDTLDKVEDKKQVQEPGADIPAYDKLTSDFKDYFTRETQQKRDSYHSTWGDLPPNVYWDNLLPEIRREMLDNFKPSSSSSKVPEREPTGYSHDYGNLSLEFKQYISEFTQSHRHANGRLSVENYWKELPSEKKSDLWNNYKLQSSSTNKNTFFSSTGNDNSWDEKRYNDLPESIRTFISEVLSSESSKWGISVVEHWCINLKPADRENLLIEYSLKHQNNSRSTIN